jgi:hypothetical protein
LTASLVGLDGSPTQSIPIFRLPGLSTGVILVQTNLTSYGQGSMTIQVTSLNDPGISSMVVGTLVAANPMPVAGPLPPGARVTLLQRFGIHRMPTTLVLHFNQPLDPVRAQNVNEYHLIGPLGQTVAITDAVYDATNDTVTLHLARRINFHRRFRLTVYGEGPSGLADAQGVLLDGKSSGHPGSNYVTTIDRHNLVWPQRKKTIGRDKSSLASHATRLGSIPRVHEDHSSSTRALRSLESIIRAPHAHGRENGSVGSSRSMSASRNSGSERMNVKSFSSRPGPKS